jgi:catalase
MHGSVESEGIGRMVRDAHAKGYGLARGEFEILSGMPGEYAQGIYAKPGRHEAMVRFSNGTNHVGNLLPTTWSPPASPAAATG